MIGDGGSGKTSLAYRLAKPNEDIPKEEERTRGVEVYNWDFEEGGKKYRANIWDFGGQTIYEAVHQYFFRGGLCTFFWRGRGRAVIRVSTRRRIGLCVRRSCLAAAVR